FARLCFFHARVRDPFDVLVAHAAFEDAFCIAYAVKAEMADVRLSRHESHLHFVANLSAPQFGIENEGIFVSRAETRSALNRACYDRSGLFAKFLEGCRGGRCVIDVANRLGVAAMRAKPFNLVEGKLWACGN